MHSTTATTAPCCKQQGSAQTAVILQLQTACCKSCAQWLGHAPKAFHVP
jgi:hypothetical protein